MEIKANFQVGQIVFLEYGDRRLYTEVIQVVTERDLCWVRPLLLITQEYEPPQVTDLRSSSDLLWSINLFQPALDTQVIGLYSQIIAKEPKPELSQTRSQQLYEFIQQFWQGNQNEEISR
ncbi:hypothetical protein IQ247_19580 [Plectonema cf. radiosum LEGE 06105]|uniref:Uncharacterized protein n=1 Tax=Plectonema cf. radiosum LEGE 06105 TaxID=945769 RepID=A0A8J7F4D5_9CYAN|nr:hypothetical protein [Plectonema radiosum]MBE9214845.1 hypothetical protein [Plectonema cf. radiosum LEGE 06105]